MNTFYLDTSAVIRWILQTPNYFSDFGNWDNAVSSILLRVEFYRAMDRLLKLKSLDESQFKKSIQIFNKLSEHVHWIKLNERILDKAIQKYEHPIGTLDAIHLATCYLYFEEFEIDNYTLLTHDTELAKVALSIGIKVIGA